MCPLVLSIPTMVGTEFLNTVEHHEKYLRIGFINIIEVLKNKVPTEIYENKQGL